MVDEAQIKTDFEIVTKFADKNQRLSWRRKKARMDDLLERVQPIQDQMLELILQKQPTMDEIEELRQKMVKECIHPEDYLVHKGTYVMCKFCKGTIQLNKD
jgi:hypothetical protein